MPLHKYRVTAVISCGGYPTTVTEPRVMHLKAQSAEQAENMAASVHSKQLRFTEVSVWHAVQEA